MLKAAYLCVRLKKRFYRLYPKGPCVLVLQRDENRLQEGWSPYLSLEDALKLDDVRAALRRGDLETAARLRRVYTLTPVAV